MRRLTTDTPNGDFETMLNYVHSKNGWAHIYDADGQEVNLIIWAINHCHDRGCDDFQCKTLEEYDEVLSNCIVDNVDCPIAMAYCFGSQTVQLRGRLKMYEDIMSLEMAQELAQAEKDGRLVVLPCKVGDVLYSIFFGRIVETKVRSFCIGHPSHRVEKCDLKLIRTDRWDIQMDNIGKTVFLTREEAEAALKKKGENNEQNKN